MAAKGAPYEVRSADWRRGSLALALAFFAALPASLASAVETAAERAERLRTMTEEQRDELVRKKRSFDEIKDEAERERLRQLHVSIESAPNGANLQRTLDRYHAWLGTLSSRQRAELRDLPADQRIDKIKELLKQQETQRFQAFVGNLGEADRQAIFKWLGEFVTQHEEEILEQLPRDQRQVIGNQADQETKQRMLGFQMAIHRQNPKMPTPGREDLNKLLASLTPETLAQIEQVPALEQPERVREMIRGAIFSRRIPPVSEDELRKFYAGLEPDQRERLEGLEREEFTRRLTWMYHAEKNGYRSGGGPGRWPGFGGGFGPPGPGRPGEGPRGEGPRGDGRRGGGRPEDGRGGPPGDRRPKGPPPGGEEPQPPPPMPAPPAAAPVETPPSTPEF